jgi:teichoic acid transport system ATP-binding protein
MENNIPAINVINITKKYNLYSNPKDILKEKLHPFKKIYHRDFYALNNFSLQVQKGETLGVIGPNGAGKSTLLKIITGVLTPTQGSVEINGKIASLLELGAGFNPEMSGYDNVFLNGEIMGFTRKQIESKMDDILDFADIGDFVHQPVKSYSSGMFARLAFATAINVDPDILIVDEALSVGDMAFQAKCFQKFRQFQTENKTILFVTHSIDLILKYCQKAVVLYDGKNIFFGDTKNATETYRKMMVKSSKMDRNFEDEEHETKKFIDISQISAQLKDKLPINKKPNTYGSMESEIIDFAIMNEKNEVTNQLTHDTNYTIYMKVRFYCTIKEPIFAFTIKSIDGMELTGTNSFNEEIYFDKAHKGEEISIKFEQRMVLNSGTYFLALGCTKIEGNELKVFHRIYDAVSVDVVSHRRAVGLAFSPSKVNYSRAYNE